MKLATTAATLPDNIILDVFDHLTHMNALLPARTPIWTSLQLNRHWRRALKVTNPYIQQNFTLNSFSSLFRVNKFFTRQKQLGVELIEGINITICDPELFDRIQFQNNPIDVLWLVIKSTKDVHLRMPPDVKVDSHFAVVAAKDNFHSGHVMDLRAVSDEFRAWDVLQCLNVIPIINDGQFEECSFVALEGNDKVISAAFKDFLPHLSTDVQSLVLIRYSETRFDRVPCYTLPSLGGITYLGIKNMMLDARQAMLSRLVYLDTKNATMIVEMGTRLFRQLREVKVRMDFADPPSTPNGHVSGFITVPRCLLLMENLSRIYLTMQYDEDFGHMVSSGWFDGLIQHSRDHVIRTPETCISKGSSSSSFPYGSVDH